ncbi:hypothetical protein HRI_001474800 [Hibiscus trionum]|uniref:DUF4219 domain-containing protein n=1 Tax=Hibiscus trionum TaxID=183268 RepID=A0A9W7HLH6_HIBTR|nr:hypothetical protein HRI_001474800 [Hibiscus trionum]
MTQSTDKPPFFDGTNYAYWKTRMMFFVKCKNYKLWDIIEDDPFVPQRSKAEWSADENMELNCKAFHFIFCALSLNIYEKMSSCESVKEV